MSPGARDLGPKRSSWTERAPNPRSRSVAPGDEIPKPRRYRGDSPSVRTCGPSLVRLTTLGGTSLGLTMPKERDSTLTRVSKDLLKRVSEYVALPKGPSSTVKTVRQFVDAALLHELKRSENAAVALKARRAFKQRDPSYRLVHCPHGHEVFTRATRGMTTCSKCARAGRKTPSFRLKERLGDHPVSSSTSPPS